VEGYSTFNELWRDCRCAMMVKLTGHAVVFGIDASKKMPPIVGELVDRALMGLSRPTKGHGAIYRFDRDAYARLRELAREEFDGARSVSEKQGRGDPGAAHTHERRFADP
jgi:hypothetical protein